MRRGATFVVGIFATTNSAALNSGIGPMIPIRHFASTARHAATLGRCNGGRLVNWLEAIPGNGRPMEDADTTALFLAYCGAAFWTNVWLGRVAELGDPDTYDGDRHEAAENATTRRLPMVNAAFDAREWARGANLLLPVGAPGLGCL